MTPIEVRRQIIEVELISLKARRKLALDLILNLDMIVEVKLLNVQIQALLYELKLILIEEKG